MPEVDETVCVKPPGSWARDFHFCVGRQASKSREENKVHNLEHFEVQLNRVFKSPSIKDVKSKRNAVGCGEEKRLLLPRHIIFKGVLLWINIMK